MNVFAKFDKIPSMILQDIKETKRNRHMQTHTQKDGQHENSIPSHKHSGGGIITMIMITVSQTLNTTM